MQEKVAGNPCKVSLVAVSQALEWEPVGETRREVLEVGDGV